MPQEALAGAHRRSPARRDLLDVPADGRGPDEGPPAGMQKDSIAIHFPFLMIPGSGGSGHFSFTRFHFADLACLAGSQPRLESSSGDEG